MPLAILFWLTLWLPGHSVLLRYFPGLIRFGWFGRLGLAYLLSCTLLSPFVIAAYFLRLPVGAVATVYSGLLVLALIDHTRHRRWGYLFRGAGWHELIPLGIVLLDCIAAGIIGAYPLGDAPVHMARSRSLLTQGMGFADPFVATPTPMQSAHVNLHHFLVALGARVSFEDILVVWKAFLVVAKLLVYSATYLVAERVFRSRWAGWAAVAFCAGATAPIEFMVYPNKLCAFWLLPIQLAFVVELIRGRTSVRTVTLFVGFTSVILGMFHPLYVGFGIVCLGCTALVWAARRSGSVLPALATAAGLPFLLGSLLLPRFPRPLAPHFQELVLSLGKLSMVSPTTGTTSHSFLQAYIALPILLVFVALFVWIARTRAVSLWILGIVLGVSNLMYNPLLATPILDVLPEGFLLFRLGGILVVCSFVVLGGGAGMGLDLLRRGLRGWRETTAIALTIFVCLITGAVWGTYHLLDDDFTWGRYRDDLRAGQRPMRPTYADLHDLRGLLADHVPAGSVVLAPPPLGAFVSAVHSTPVVAIPIGHTNYSLPDALDRQRDIRLLFEPLGSAAGLAAKKELLEEYDVAFLVQGNGDSSPTRFLPAETVGPTVGAGLFVLYRITTP